MLSLVECETIVNGMSERDIMNELEEALEECDSSARLGDYEPDANEIYAALLIIELERRKESK